MAKVLSTTSRAPASWAMTAVASMSPMLSIGFVGVSIQTSFVLPGLMAARIASRSETGAGLWSNPQTFSTFSNRRKVPPYASSGITAWSPGTHRLRMRVSSAASPEANAKPRSPSSRAAMLLSRAVRVGFAERLYS